METEIKIKIPEGMEIDKENSTFECIRFKPKKLTYNDIQNKIIPYTRTIYTTFKHHQKCVTFRKLLEVADYLNGDWKPDWNNKIQIKHFISYNHENKKLSIFDSGYTNLNAPCFSSIENALKAIEIIGEEELKQFFS